MTEDFVTYEQAVKLKELGFDWEVEHFYVLNDANEPKLCRLPDALGGEDNHNKYHGSFSVPTLYQTQKWLREKGFEVNSTYEIVAKNGWFYYINDLSKDIREWHILSDEDKFYPSYEQALSAGIDHSLEIIIEKELKAKS